MAGLATLLLAQAEFQSALGVETVGDRIPLVIQALETPDTATMKRLYAQITILPIV